jgi:hypothetical protein
VAYSLSGKTVIRSGYGMFIEPNNVNGLSNISANGIFRPLRNMSARTTAFHPRSRWADDPAELQAGAVV